MSLAEALHAFGLLGATFPRFVTSIDGSGDVIDLVVDARAMNNLPAPIKLATKLVPAVRSHLKVASFADGVATVEVDATAGGLPAHKLLGLGAGRIESILAHRNVPAGAVKVGPGAQVVLDVQKLLAAKNPGVQVNGMEFKDGSVVLDVDPAL
ncbi:MAG: hypothetical protein FWF90_11030 [Promicromonosporaceae bacterium]|nr:hypothetical protein [Promicromonosporaceae bacterium]